MLNIKFKGKYKDESQLTKSKFHNEGNIFKEPNTLNEAFFKGFFVYLPFLMILIALCYFKIINENYHVSLGDVSFILIASSLISLICTLFHELIHAVNFPFEAVKEIWIKPKDLAAFVYCNEKVSKNRFIWISLAPSLILGLLPLSLWFTGLIDFNIRISLITMIIAHINLFTGIGDYLNVWLTIRQVPAKASVYNSGFHSYWIAE